MATDARIEVYEVDVVKPTKNRNLTKKTMQTIFAILTGRLWWYHVVWCAYVLSAMPNHWLLSPNWRKSIHLDRPAFCRQFFRRIVPFRHAKSDYLWIKWPFVWWLLRPLLDGNVRLQFWRKWKETEKKEKYMIEIEEFIWLAFIEHYLCNQNECVRDWFGLSAYQRYRDRYRAWLKERGVKCGIARSMSFVLHFMYHIRTCYSLCKQCY